MHGWYAYAVKPVMRIFFFLLFSVLVMFGVPCTSYAQRYYFRHYMTDDGLSHNTVLSILQDKRGFMWLGTKDGLNRFDGFNFKKFPNPHQQFGSVGDDQIHSMCEDTEGKLWLATGRGLYHFDPKTETFSDLILRPSERVGSVVTDGRTIYFLSSGRLWSYEQTDKKLIRYNISANCLVIDKKKQLVMGNDTGEILRFNLPGKQLLRTRVIGHSLPASSQVVTAVIQAGQEFIIGTSKLGLLSFNLLTGKSKTLLQQNGDGTRVNVRSVFAEKPGEFWVATESGVYIYHSVSQTITVFKKTAGDPYAINDNAIYAFCRDTEGGMWIGTYFGGVNYYTAKNSRFRKYYFLNGKNSVRGNAVSAISEDEQHRIWIGTEDAGISSLDVRRGTVKNFLTNDSPGSIGHSNVHSLLISGNQLFAGFYDHGLEVLDIHSGRVIERFGELGAPSKANSNFVLCLLKSRQGKIYLGTIGSNAGLFEFNQKTREISAVKGVTYRDGIFALIEDHQGHIWIGSDNQGAFRYNPLTGQTIQIKFGNGTTTNDAAEPTVQCIYEDSRHNIWFGTEGGGVIKLDRNGIIRTKYDTRSGLSSNYIYRIIEDDRHQLWMSSVKGLMRMNPVNGKVTTYTQANGLITDQFNYSSAYRATDGILYFGTVKGLIAFNPNDFNHVLKAPPLYLTTLEINNKSVSGGKIGSPLKTSISITDRIVLAHDQNNINLEFAALDYSAARAIKYRYRMLGMSDSWIYLSKNRKVYFTGLPPGKYVFEFAAAGNTGEWKTAEKRLTIQIDPPAYRTTSAYLIYAAIAFLSIYSLIVNYKRYIHNQHDQKMEKYEHEKAQEIYQSKLVFFTNIAHELRTPLTLIKLPLDQLISITGFDEKVKDYLRMINKNTNRLIELTNQFLNFRKSDQENLSLIFVKTNVNTLLQSIYEDFQIIAREKRLSYQLELPRHLTLHAYLDIEAFRKIMVNLISNAFKYAERTISIKFVPINSEDDFFSLEVKSDGPVIPVKYQEKIFEPFFRIDQDDKNSGTGIGLSLARSLAAMHKGTLVLSTDDHFNIFTLSLPLHQQVEIDFTVEDPAAEDSGSGASEPALPAYGLPTVLLVEDHHDILKYIAKQLQGEYFILKANDGVEAIEFLEKYPIQLVVSDIMMPRMDGLELCTNIKTNLNYSHIPVILLTAKNSLDARVEGLGTGADVYIDKPFSMSHLEMQIKSLLKNRKLVKEHFARFPLSEIKGVAYSKIDINFLEQLTTTVSDKLSDAALDVEALSKAMNMSRPTLYRKIKALTNMTPSTLIARYRLKYAAELLAAKQYKINEIAFMVGYNSPANFTRDFQKQFGNTPSAYVKELDI